VLYPKSVRFLEQRVTITLENVEYFNYLGSILNAGNKMNIENAERIAKDNKTYYSN
jgi:hypothetical protein